LGCGSERHVEQGRQAGGRKEYTDDAGNVTEVVEWFGFKLHLLVDAKHEMALRYEITDTKAGDGETLPTVLAQAQQNLPRGRIQTLAYDKAADTNDVHELLSREGIKPVIHNRKLWKEEPLRMLPGHDGNSNIVYDESGTVFCYDRVSQQMVRHPMAYIYEPQTTWAPEGIDEHYGAGRGRTQPLPPLRQLAAHEIREPLSPRLQRLRPGVHRDLLPCLPLPGLRPSPPRPGEGVRPEQPHTPR
jgi:hypothetical protein